MTTLNETLLDGLLGKLESACSWSPRVISKLENLIHAGDDYALFRVNPIPKAYFLVRQHFDTLGSAVNDCEGHQWNASGL